MAARPAFIVLEGGDGCGKSTQAGILVARLRELGREVVATREPGATEAGAAIRALVLGGGDLDPRAEALLIAADRAEHVARVIRPALERGAVVVSDRYVPSSLVYQGVVRGLGVEMVEKLSAIATQGLAPDLVLVLDVTDDVAAARQGTEPDRLEREGAQFHAAVRRAYRDLAPARGWVVVDANATVDDVAARVRAAIDRLLAG